VSRENVETAVRGLSIFREQQRPSGLHVPDYVWSMSGFPGWPGRMEYVGADDFMEFFDEWKQPYEEWDMELEEAVDAGGEHVVCVCRQRGRLRGAASWVDLQFGLLMTFEDGLIARIEVHAPPEAAFAAAGVERDRLRISRS
jgi:ketosteroid isomerase-like protein